MTLGKALVTHSSMVHVVIPERRQTLDRTQYTGKTGHLALNQATRPDCDLVALCCCCEWGCWTPQEAMYSCSCIA
jgi:hypothetical protein